MNTDNMTDESARDALINLINEFLGGALRERWLYFARLKKIPWQKIDPYRVYVGASSDCIAAQPLNCKRMNSVIDSYHLQDIRNERVWVLSTGHGAKGASMMFLEEALSNEKSPLEGFIIVRPGKLVICIGHHGDVWVLMK
jgi:hypothetical protein